jgi:glucosyl-dolichyl phosphate glucuronosyltransferase
VLPSGARELGSPDLPRCDVIICAYTARRWGQLVAAVASVRAQTYHPATTILVIDHNPDLFARAQRELSGVAVMENKYRPGIPGARNTGIDHSTAEVVAFLDDDATASPDWLAQLVSAYANPLVLGAGGSIDPVWATGRPTWFPDEFGWVVGCTYRGMPIRDGAVRNLIGANMSFRRLVFDHVGGFRDELARVGSRPVGGEETELCIRMLKKWPGHRLEYKPGARVWHFQPPERSRWRYFWTRCYFEGRSKAEVSRIAGPSMGLASERSYALRALPEGFLRGVRDTWEQHDSSGIARSAAIGGGLAVTAFGYLTGMALIAIRWAIARLSPTPADRFQSGGPSTAVRP